MPVTLTIRDETMTGEVYHEMPLEFPSEQVTVRELIRSRVYEEVQNFNRQSDADTFQGLVQPTDTEKVLNGKRNSYKLQKHRQLDWKEQFEKATEAFDRNGFFILVGDRQAESLEEVVTIRPETNVSFVKLTMLVGG
ncbi:MAG: hypothetical protein KDA65_17400 [Planctomycetaceae bacterium]|nr:hypothetical protein [Planctomycetaceae bacterium]